MYSSNTVKMGLLVNFLTGRQSFLFVRLELFVAACLKPLFLLEYCLAAAATVPARRTPLFLLQ